MVIISIDEDIACLHICRVERNDCIACITDKCIDVDDALVEFVCEERIVAIANLRDRFDTSIRTILHVLAHEILSRVHNIHASARFCAIRLITLRDIRVRNIEALCRRLLVKPLYILVRIEARHINAISRRHIVILTLELCCRHRVNVRVRHSRWRHRFRPRYRAAIYCAHSRAVRMSYTTSRTKYAHWQRAHGRSATGLHLVLSRIEERAIRLATVLILYLLLRHLLHVLAEHIGRSIESICRNSTLPAALPKAAERIAAENSTVKAGREHIYRQFLTNHTIHLAEDFRVREPLIL